MTSEDRAPVDFGFGEEEEMLRDLARKFLDERIPVETLRQLVAPSPVPVYEQGEPPAWDRSVWEDLVELGWAGLAVEEKEGGAGVSMVGIAALVEEVGRHALPSPLLACLACSLVLRSADSEVARRRLGQIAQGTPAALAITPGDGSWEPERSDIQARRVAGELTLDGTAHFVQDALKADFFVVTARLNDKLLLCTLPADAPGLSVEQNHIHDLTRDQATLRFRQVRVSPSSVVTDDGAEVLRRAWPSLLVLASADLCGSSEWQLQATVEYAKNRKQFDRPLGFFQAVKHPLVNAMVEIDRARSLLYHAASCIDAASVEAEKASRMAKSAASDAGAFISDRSVQLHGGIGFTWESDVHIFFKRSLHGQVLWGDGIHHRKKLAEILIDRDG
ncbi:MAG: acyl-CoA/acyl-ACP dehydrogenase [Myxococcota bacterium]|nr:acyl-CoA/acyl-ACP dehydrogenase [Myxococcota bacterium]